MIKYPPAIDELIARFTVKFGTLAWCMYCQVFSNALNSLHNEEKYKAGDFYSISEVKLTKKEKIMLKRIAKREWTLFIW